MEQDLIRRIVKGDEAAFSELLEQYQNMVFSVAINLLSNEQDAYDVSQEVFLKVFRSIRSFSGNSKLSTWIYRIAKNMCIDHIRKQKKQSALPLEAPLAAIIMDNSPGPELMLERKEQIHLLRVAVEMLPSDMRTVLVLRDIENLSYHEISKILQIPLGTVKSRVSRARDSLKKILLSDKELSEN